MSELNKIVLKIISNGKGILAADESNGTMTKRLEAVNIASNSENRLLFREILFSSESMRNCIGGVILYDETINQTSSSGKSIPDLIYSIKTFEQDFNFLNNKELSFKTLSEKLKIPNSHLKFLIKYYNNLTIHEYFNFLKVSLSIKFIQQGFLHEHTIESLSKASHFESRITFFNNFKKFTGKSPSEFIKN